MLALVSSITTAVNGCDSFENSAISAGLPLSSDAEVGALEAGHQSSAGVDDRRINRHGANGRSEDRLFGLLRQHHRTGERSYHADERGHPEHDRSTTLL